MVLRRRTMVAVVAAATVLTGCSDAGGPDPSASTPMAPVSSTSVATSPEGSAAPETAPSAAPTIDHGDALTVGTTVRSDGGVGPVGEGDPVDWAVTVRGIEWVEPREVQGDYSDGWIPSAKIYLAVDLDYAAGTTDLVYSTADWTFAGDDGADGILGKAGGGGSQEPLGLDPAGEVPSGERRSGRIFFGLPAPTSGVLTLTTLTEGELARWSVPGA